MSSFASKTKSIVEYVLEFIYPPRCMVCQELAGFGSGQEFICEKCMEKLKYADNVSLHFDMLKFHKTEIAFDIGYAAFKYETVKPLIEAFKFSKIKSLGKFIAGLMNDFALQRSAYDDIDIFVPVPISRERFIERGFNQTEVLAEHLSMLSGIAYVNALKRDKNTVAQFRINDPQKRIGNLKDAFTVIENITGLNILLIEDIFTTGATLNECAATLKKAGANRVDFLSFSISV